jgi:hypothetical protein
MNHERNNREEQQQMNQPASNVKHQKAPGPNKDQKQRDQQEWSKSHE